MDRQTPRCSFSGAFPQRGLEGGGNHAEPLKIIPTGEDQWVIVKMPNGFEYKEMEVAQATTLKSTGAIKFNWKGTHSSLAHVEQTDKGLVA